MAKRKETLEIESILHYMCRKRRIYGCEEVTIGFYHNGHGNEIVDYCTMDSKGILRCYEIKVTLSDLKSKAKKSWYGHYNYLFVTEELFEKIYNKYEEYGIPDYVGVCIPCSQSWSDGVEVRRNAKKQNISQEQATMMKESLVRSMSYKIQKLRDAADMEKVSKLKSDIRKLEKENAEYCNEVGNLNHAIRRFERILRNYYGREFWLEEFVENIEKEKKLLPEEIRLTLTERGKKINQIIEDSMKEA